MFRWRVMAFRLLLVTMFAIACWVTARAWSPWGIRQVAQKAFGSAFDFEACQVDWNAGSVEFSNVAVPDSEDPMRNLLQGNQMWVRIDPNSLWRPQWVLERVDILGVALGTPRDKLASDRFNGVGNSWRTVKSEPVQYDLSAAAKQWIDQIQSGPPIRFQENDELEQLCADIRRTWQNEFESRHKELFKSQQEIEAAMTELGADHSNPLRSADRNRHLQTRLDELRQKYQTTRAWLETWQADHSPAVERLREARAVSSKPPMPVALGGKATDALAALLISENDLSTSCRILAWTSELHRRMETMERLAGNTQSRGTEVLIPGMQMNPRILIKELNFEGACTLDGERFLFTGACHQLSDRPELAESPIEFHLKGQGQNHFHLDGFIDRSEPIPLTEFRFSWLPTDAPKAELGTANSILVSLTPHRSQTDATIRVRGDRLEGTITCFHSKIGMLVTALTNVAGGQEVLDKLNGQLGTIQQVEVVATLSGTLKQPQITFNSDLAEPLSVALVHCINQELEEIHQRNKLTRDRSFESELNDLRVMAANELKRMEETIQSQRMRLSDLEKSLPSGSIR